MYTFTLIIRAAPYASTSARTALGFANAVLASGNSINCLFFQDEGVLNAGSHSTPPQDEPNIPQAWATLISSYDIDAVVCVASALKHGIVDTVEANRYELKGSTMHPSFVIGGLGSLVDACSTAHRVLHFS
jgi:tRNA 2-thiouridine synthesizing protein D